MISCTRRRQIVARDIQLVFLLSSWESCLGVRLQKTYCGVNFEAEPSHFSQIDSCSLHNSMNYKSMQALAPHYALSEFERKKVKPHLITLFQFIVNSAMIRRVLL
jgi:hypothetical protein